MLSEDSDPIHDPAVQRGIDRVQHLRALCPTLPFIGDQAEGVLVLGCSW